MHDYVSFNTFDLVVQISKSYIMVVIVCITLLCVLKLKILNLKNFGDYKVKCCLKTIKRNTYSVHLNTSYWFHSLFLYA